LFVQEKSISEKLAKLVEEMTYSRLPSGVVRKVKYCILDLFGAYFAGYDLKSCDPVKAYIRSLNAPPQATVWGMKARTSFIDAAFANSAMSHLTVFDDMHAKTASHYGSMVIPAAVAIGEHLRCSGRDLIVAIVAGYETAIRIGSAMITPRFSQSGFRPSGTFGVFGSAMTTSKLFRLNVDEMVYALGLAGNFGVGLMAFAEEGTDDLMYHNAFASRNGILSAELARHGATSPRRIFEIDGGVLKTYSGEIEAEGIVFRIEDHFKIEEVYFKAVPACAFVQSAAKAALEIAQARDFQLEDVRKIEVGIFPNGKDYPGLDYCGPFHGVMQAQMSNPFTIASILIRKGLRFEDFVNFKDPAVQSLAARIQINQDAEAASRWPAEQLVKIEVFLRDGSTRRATSTNPHFLTDEEVVEKCRSSLKRVLDARACDRLIETVQSLEKVENLDPLTRILNEIRI
jgi:2-methylcitrate dehydratase PrpD